MTDLNKMLVLIVILLIMMIILCGCEDKHNNEMIRQCELLGGSTVIEYCKGSKEICKVKCVVNKG